MSDSLHYDEIIEVLKHTVSAILKVPTHRITPDSTLTDLAHVESIKLLRIAGKIERKFGVELDNEALFRKGTLGDLASEIMMLRRATA